MTRASIPSWSSYGIEPEDIDIYGEWRGILRPDQAIYVHRRHFPVSKIDLRFKGRPTR